MKKKVILDTDPGIDDAVALAVALSHEEIELKLITTVAGNVSLDKTTKNVLRLLGFFGKNVPVACGAVKPLVKCLEDASDIHGDTGLNGYDFPEPTNTPIKLHAVEAMKNVISKSKDPIDLVTIGPLTNIALLFSMYPECKGNIKRIVMMGGSASRGNHTPVAEFNICVDPEAAKIVFQSGVAIVMCGLDVTNQAILLPADIEVIKKMNRTGKMLYSLFQNYRGGSLTTGLKMHDLCAVAYLVRPDLFNTQDCFVDVETGGVYSAGCTIVDLKNKFKKAKNATVCLEINVVEFRRWFIDRLKKII